MKNKQSDLSPARPPSLFATVARDAAPVWLGMFALGVGLGVLVTSNGLPWWLAPIISGTVYAGSVEFLLPFGLWKPSRWDIPSSSCTPLETSYQPAAGSLGCTESVETFKQP